VKGADSLTPVVGRSMDIDVAMGAYEPSMGAAAGFSAQLEGINSGSV